MKKYVKPELIFESFEMTQQVAACDFDHNNNAQEALACVFSGTDSDTGYSGALFTDAIEGCDTETEAYCYHQGAVGFFKLFNS